MSHNLAAVPDPDFGKAYPRLKGRCPSCGAESLFRGSGGYVTCGVMGCKAPAAAADLLSHDARRTAEAFRELQARWTPLAGKRLMDLTEHDFQHLRGLVLGCLRLANPDQPGDLLASPVEKTAS